MLIRDAENRGSFEGYKCTRGAPFVLHLFFADDSIFLGKVVIGNSKTIIDVLEMYNKASGQTVNLEK